MTKVYKEYDLKYGYSSLSGVDEFYHKHFLTMGRVEDFIIRFLISRIWVEGDKISFEIEPVMVESE